jgi:hypothetical protein
MPIRIGGVMSEVTASAILAIEAPEESEPGRGWVVATILALPMWAGIIALLATFF